ncbi:MAG: Diaminopimelate decarboxylase [Cryomorphaceae bacterium]|nr:MAG: Diaminopimelate decarboxylase [Cryomorphaceae bacterium]
MTTFPLNQATDWVEEFGSPLYVYDAATIAQQYRRISGAFDDDLNVGIHFACKALNNLNILRLLKAEGAGLDAVSLGEIHLGLQAGFTPDEILFTPNGVGMGEIRAAVEIGVHINIDNLETLEEFANEFGNSIPICVRINPHIMAGGNAKISVGHIDSKFGISIYQMRHLHRIVDHMGLHVHGLHMHTGSDIIDIASFMRGANLLLEVAHDFKELTYIDFGSGFKIGYKPQERTTDIEAFGATMSARFKEFCLEYGRDLQLIFEPVKFLVSEAGAFLTTVNSTKTTPSTVFAQVDSGFNHFPRPMLYDAYHHIENISNPEGENRLYTIVGYICETDTFGYDRQLSEVRRGDVLAFHNAGAYCSTMASNYNSRVRPAEVLVKDGQAHLIRERETIEDLTRGIVALDLFQEEVKASEEFVLN